MGCRLVVVAAKTVTPGRSPPAARLSPLYDDDAHTDDRGSARDWRHGEDGGQPRDPPVRVARSANHQYRRASGCASSGGLTTARNYCS